MTEEELGRRIKELEDQLLEKNQNQGSSQKVRITDAVNLGFHVACGFWVFSLFLGVAVWMFFMMLGAGIINW